MFKIFKKSVRPSFALYDTSRSVQSQAALVKNYNEIPGPNSLPIVGNLFDLKSFGKQNPN